MRNKRLEHAHGLEQIFKTLHVATVGELLDAYTMTASKILSLWDRHGEQEQDVERLDGEIREIRKEISATPKEAAARAAAGAAAGGGGAAPQERDSSSLDAKERDLDVLCREVQTAFEEGDMLREHHGLKDTGVSVTQHNLLAFLGLLESAAVRVARLHRGMLLQRKQEEEAENDVGSAAEEGAADDADPSSPGSGESGDTEQAAAATAAEAAKAKALAAKRSRQMTIQPPSMEGFITHHHEKAGSSEQVIGLGERRYGRKSLRSELMQQILAGVQTQMEKMHEEEILVKIGEKTREASHSQLIDKTKRDSNIDGWLQKRQSQSKLDLGGNGSGPPSLAGGSKPTSALRERPGSASRSGAHGSGAGAARPPRAAKRGGGGAGARSAPQLLGLVDGGMPIGTREAAACLPKTMLKPLPSRGGSGGGAAAQARSRALQSSCSFSHCASLGVGSMASASTPALHGYAAKGGGGGGGGGGRARAYGGGSGGVGVSSGSCSGAYDPAAHDIVQLNQTLLELQREREQIAELKQLAMAAGGMGAPLLGMKGGVLRNLSSGGSGPVLSSGANVSLHPLPTRLDPSSLDESREATRGALPSR